MKNIVSLRVPYHPSHRTAALPRFLPIYAEAKTYRPGGALAGPMILVDDVVWLPASNENWQQKACYAGLLVEWRAFLQPGVAMRFDYRRRHNDVPQ